ncbi:MAG: putative nucleotide binding protein [Halobacteriales archaeon]|jgi:putative nucleotide binding protein
MTDSEGDVSDARRAVLLDFFPTGRSEGGPRGYERQPLGYGLGRDSFRLFEIVFEEDADVGIGDAVVVAPEDERDRIVDSWEIDHDDLSGGAESELEYAIREIVESEEDRFVGFFNDAQPITLRLHQLNLLPGIGEKLRNSIIDERKRTPFESFEELEGRVDGLHDARDTLVERIMEELQEEDLKYRLFARREDAE